MSETSFTEKEKSMADFCKDRCPVCQHARTKQKGIAYTFVKTIESGICPFCKAYEKVYGRKSHERFE